MKNKNMPDPKVKVFQINDVSEFPGFDKFKVSQVNLELIEKHQYKEI